jgi:hypothetical protein
MSSPQDALNIATATASSEQALAAALQQHTLQPAQQTKVTLPPFWSHDLAAWFQHIEAEFIIARVPLTSYLCYLHVIRALPADVVTANQHHRGVHQRVLRCQASSPQTFHNICTTTLLPAS